VVKDEVVCAAQNSVDLFSPESYDPKWEPSLQWDFSLDVYWGRARRERRQDELLSALGISRATLYRIASGPPEPRTCAYCGEDLSVAATRRRLYCPGKCGTYARRVTRDPPVRGPSKHAQ